MEVDELHRCLDVLRHRVTRDVVVVVAQVERNAHLLAVESFLHVVVRECAQSACFHHGAEVFQVDEVLWSVESLTALSHCLEHDFVVLEVGLLQHHLGAVAQFQFLVSELCVLLLLYNLARFRHCVGSDERLVLGVVNISLEFLAAHFADGLCHTSLVGISLAILLLCHDEHHKVRVLLADEFLSILVNHLNANHRRLDKLRHHLIFHLDRRYWLVVEIVVAIEIAVGGVLHLVAVVVLLLQLAQVLVLAAVVLTRSETELAHALCLAIDGSEGLEVLAVLRHSVQLEVVHCLREDILSVLCIGSNEWAVGLLCHFLEAQVEHHADNTLCILVEQVADVLLLLFFHDFVLHHHAHERVFLFLVFLEDVDRLGIVGHWLVNHLCCVGRNHSVFPEVLDYCLYMVDVNIADNDDCLVVWAIPLAVVCAEHVGLEVVNDFHKTDRQALAVLTARIECWQNLLVHALAGSLVELPLLMNDTALLVYFLRVECQAVRPVLQNEDTRVDGCSTLCRHVADAVNRLVDRGVSIEVATELHAQ